MSPDESQAMLHNLQPVPCSWGSGYGRMADIWSFGCVIIEMGTAQLPWGRLVLHEITDFKLQAPVNEG